MSVNVKMKGLFEDSPGQLTDGLFVALGKSQFIMSIVASILFEL